MAVSRLFDLFLLVFFPLNASSSKNKLVSLNAEAKGPGVVFLCLQRVGDDPLAQLPSRSAKKIQKNPLEKVSL